MGVAGGGWFCFWIPLKLLNSWWLVTKIRSFTFHTHPFFLHTTHVRAVVGVGGVYLCVFLSLRVWTNLYVRMYARLCGYVSMCVYMCVYIYSCPRFPIEAYDRV